MTTLKIPYNTSETPLRLPEYGRMVTQMIEHARHIEDRVTRTLYARKIVKVMESVNDALRDEDHYEQKLWNHLALLSEYALDIDCPVEVLRKEDREPVTKLSYPGNPIRYRHYGRLVEELLEHVAGMEPSAQRDCYVSSVARRMRLDLMDWRGDRGNLNVKVAADIENYTRGKVTADEVMKLFEKELMPRPKKRSIGNRRIR